MQRNASDKRLAVITEGFETDGGSVRLGDLAVREFHETHAKEDQLAVAVCAIKALTTVIKHSRAQTLMGLSKDLEEAATALESVNPTAIDLRAACQLFLRFTTRISQLELLDIDTAKARLIERGNQFEETSKKSRITIAELGSRFIRPGCTVLLHGYSRVVMEVLKRAMQSGNHFSAILTEGRPNSKVLPMARALKDLGVPITIIMDSGVARAMDRVDMVFVGAEAVVENGGVVNKLGTYQIALCAKACNKPLYVAAESYKFARLFPLNQQDIPEQNSPNEIGPLLPEGTVLESPTRDYTPPAYISLLVTDLGVLTPAAVSDELIQLYV